MVVSHQPHTVIDLLAAGKADHPAIIVPNGPVITYGSLRKQIERLSGQLAAAGVQRSDRVGLVLPNGPEVAVLFLAVAAVATAAPLNQAYTKDEFRFYIEDSKVHTLITLPGAAPAAREAAYEDTLLMNVTMDGTGEISLHVEKGAKKAVARTEPKPDDVALVLHTSGTTSRPKRVPLTHGNLVTSVGNIADSYKLTSEDISLCVMPLFHVHGIVASLLAALGAGGSVVAPKGFDALAFWRWVNAHKVTWYSAVPSMHQALVALAKRREAGTQYHNSLQFIRSCSSSLAPSLMQDMELLFRVPVLEAYGMTEAAHQMASNPLPPSGRKPGSVGRATGVQVAIMDEAGTILPPNTPGEVVIKGANVTRGYEENPEANRTSYTNGWFRTGDEGIIDSAGYLTLVSRIKELINRAGEKIAPREIDEVLMTHPAVSEAVAFSLPSDRYGEEVGAAVVLREPATEAELTAFCKTKLAPFKVPRTIYIVNEIPKTASGKLQRRIVAAHFAEKK